MFKILNSINRRNRRSDKSIKKAKLIFSKTIYKTNIKNI